MKNRAMEVGDALRASRDTQAIAAANGRMRGAWKNAVAEFLQLHHTQSFGTDWLGRYLLIPHRDLLELCDELIDEGLITRPENTQYVRGVAVDWKAVHEGRAVRPAWAYLGKANG